MLRQSHSDIRLICVLYGLFRTQIKWFITTMANLKKWREIPLALMLSLSGTDAVGIQRCRRVRHQSAPPVCLPSNISSRRSWIVSLDSGIGTMKYTGVLLNYNTTRIYIRCSAYISTACSGLIYARPEYFGIKYVYNNYKCSFSPLNLKFNEFAFGAI